MHSRITARKALFHTSVGTTSRLFKVQSSLFSSSKWVAGHNTFIRIHTSVRTPLFKQPLKLPARKTLSRPYCTSNVKTEAELLAMEMYQQTALTTDLCKTFEKSRGFFDKYKFIMLYTTATLLSWKLVLQYISEHDPESYPKRPFLQYTDFFLTPSPLASTKDQLKIEPLHEPNSNENIYYEAFKKSIAEPFWHMFQFPADLVGINYKGDDIIKSRKEIEYRAGLVELFGTLILPFIFFSCASGFSFRRNLKLQHFASQAWDKSGVMASGQSYDVIRSIFNGNRMNYVKFLSGPFSQLASRLHSAKVVHAFNLMFTIPLFGNLCYNKVVDWFKQRAALNDEQTAQLENNKDVVVMLMYVGGMTFALARTPYVFMPAVFAHIAPKCLLTITPIYDHLISWVAGEDIETIRDKYRAAELVRKINNKQ